MHLGLVEMGCSGSSSPSVLGTPARWTPVLVLPGSMSTGLMCMRLGLVENGVLGLVEPERTGIPARWKPVLVLPGSMSTGLMCMHLGLVEMGCSGSSSPSVLGHSRPFDGAARDSQWAKVLVDIGDPFPVVLAYRL
jgi:hypothetical protein